MNGGKHEVLSSELLFKQSGWIEYYGNDGPNGTNCIWCPKCYNSDS
jgi:hypothetical protein